MDINDSSFKNKLSEDVLWNASSLVFLSISGLALNFLIALNYGAEFLGIFNITFALYIVISQLAAFGLHLSILRFASELFSVDQEQLAEAVFTGFLLVSTISFLATYAAWLATPFVALIFKNDNITFAYQLLLPGLFAFSLNKYLLAVLNGARHMRAFAIFQSSRYVFILGALLTLIVTQQSAEFLTSIISIAELTLLPVLALHVFYSSRILEHHHLKFRKSWLKIHCDFGARVFMSSTISELNTRVDVLMIGAFLGDVKAGIYSIAILLAEGLGQFSVVVRNNINPLLTRFILENKLSELREFGRRISTYFFFFMLVSGSFLILAFPFFVSWISDGSDFASAYPSLVILTVGLIIASPYLPFNMIFSQASLPAMQTIFTLLTVLTNISLNAIAIPLAGIEGAAIATSASYIFSVILLVYICKRVLEVKIWI